MSALFVALAALILFALGYRFYGTKLARLWAVDPSRKTPAVEKFDGVDFVPARHWTVLFGHHFASIAGAGPIIGPVIAGALWGWVPVLIWIVGGSILLGAVHDFSTLMISLRHQGSSIAEVARSTIGYRAKMLFASFVWLALILVIAVFAAVAGKTLATKPEVVVPTFGLILVALTVGVLLYRLRVNQIVSTLVGIALLAGLVFLGYKRPIDMPSLTLGNTVIAPATTWTIILLIYAYIASVIPVNILLQPRDYLATFVLYFGLILGYLGILTTRPVFHVPAFIGWNTNQGMLWPMLFVIVACGAISGFHSLIASGTSSKQLASEKDAHKIGYGAMILEGVLAALALVAVGAGLNWTGDKLLYREILKESGWIVTFSTGFSQLTRLFFVPALGTLIAITILKTFVMTTLDSATRISRYLSEELFGEGLKLKFMKNKYLATLVIIVISGYLALGRWQAIWPVFGAANQLVAALALVVISVFLLGKGKNGLYTLIPAGFMLLTTIGALIYQITKFFPEGKNLLGIIAVVLLALAAFMLADACRAVSRIREKGLRKEFS